LNPLQATFSPDEPNLGPWHRHPPPPPATDHATAQTAGEPLEIPDALREEWEILTAGAVDVLPAKELLARLIESREKKKPLRVKLGLDPSAPDLHVGHTIVINKLQQFQRFGHQVVVIVGDFTARIGDPTGKSETRPQLTLDQVRENAQTYLDQIFLILDRDKTEVVRNGEWFEPMTMNDVVRLASRYTVARMLERDDFSKRYRDGRPIHIHEFLYPLVQGYDSIMVRSDIEIGGTDQKFNLLVGRDLMEQEGMRGQCILTTPLLVGLDGVQKMSKSLGNAIGLTDPPEDIFGKAMSVPDELMKDYLLLALAYPPREVERLLDEAQNGTIHPRDLKARIARELTARYHGEEAARGAEAHFDKVFRSGENPDEIEESRLRLEGSTLRLTSALVGAGLAKSNGEAKRLIRQGGVRVDDARISDEDHELPAGAYLVRVGKRHFRRIHLS
jgi:tyrosyl-tRNA synthetase